MCYKPPILQHWPHFQVSKVDAYRNGPQLNQMGVRVSLTCTKDCCLAQYPKQACRKDVPTRAHAAELLLAMLRDRHAECIADRDCWNKGETSAAPTAFSHISGVQRKVSELHAARQREGAEHQNLRAAMAAVTAAA